MAKFGYVFASKMLFEPGRTVKYFYHEESDTSYDSGWRFFCGDETQEYFDDPENTGIYDIKSILEVSPEVLLYLDTDDEIAFAYSEKTGNFVREALVKLPELER